MYLLETANIMFLSFIRFELLSFEHGNPISHTSMALLLGYNQAFFRPEVHLFSTYFVHIWKSSLVFYGKELIVQSLYVHLKDRKAGWK